jgi:microcystin degradation protein MlrC
MAPHEDAIESKARAITNLLDRLESGKGKPKYKAWVPIPILLPGEKTSTRIEPSKSLYAEIPSVEKQEGVIDAAIWIGYAWADESRNHGVVMVTGDNEEQVTAGAEKLANAFWEVRNKFEFVAPVATLEESLKMALAQKEKPFIISDMGDNPTAGGAGDVTWTLQQLLAQPEFRFKNGPSVIYASIPGPELIKEALKVGIGGKISTKAGAQVDNRFAPPLLLEGTVTAIREGDRDAEVEAVVQVGSINIIVTNKRKPYHQVKDFTDLNLNPSETDILVVKIGYLVPELYDIRKGWIMALTPGGVDQDLDRLGHKNIKRPMFPLDADMDRPDLSARLLKASHQLN